MTTPICHRDRKRIGCRHAIVGLLALLVTAVFGSTGFTQDAMSVPGYWKLIGDSGVDQVERIPTPQGQPDPSSRDAPSGIAPLRGTPSQAPVVYPGSSVIHGGIPMNARVPGGCQACATGTCRTCVDRNGAGGLETFKYEQGICANAPEECQCWQCPYNSPFNRYCQGGYAGPARTAHVAEYRLRPGDVVQFTFLLSDRQMTSSYRLTVGDELLIESEADEVLTRGTLEKGLEIQPDGTITLRFVGSIQAAGQTVDQLRETLNEKYEELELYADPAIDVTPVSTGTASKRIRDAISGTGGFTAQFVTQTVTPQGEVRLPGIGSVWAQGLTLEELKQEINLRYEGKVGGIEVEPALQQQAPHYVYVLGEVAQPGRFNMDQPTTVMGAIALAGGNIPGANLRQVVIFRRGENWELMSTLLDLRAAILGNQSNPRDEIWVQDGDVIILPSMPIRLFDNFVRLVFTEGIYGIVPFQGFSVDLGNGNN